MRIRLLTHFTLVTSTVLIATGALATITSPSPHRKVVDGIGNCVFSTEELLYQKDSSYQLTTEFTAPQAVHARCYYPKTLQEYKTMGKTHNSLRASSYFGSFGLKNESTSLSTNKYTVKKETSDQQRFDIDGTGENTDFGINNKITADKFGATQLRKATQNTEYAIDMGKYVKAMAEMAGKYPFTATFCIKNYIEYADESKVFKHFNEKTKTWSESLPTQVIKIAPLAEGCFDYTIKNASDVN
jgi:hypothetical protein